MLSLSIQAITQVAVAVICYQDRYLLAQRGKHQHQGDKLEFVGGKIEEGELSKNALLREIKEELGFDFCQEKISPLGQIHHDYGDKQVCLWVYLVQLSDKAYQSIAAVCQGVQGQPLYWLSLNELLQKSDELPQANTEILVWLGQSKNTAC